MTAVCAPALSTQAEGVDFHAWPVGNYRSRFAIKKASRLAAGGGVLCSRDTLTDAKYYLSIKRISRDAA